MAGSRILVVEDDPRLAATLERVLAAEGHDVEVAGDGGDGVPPLRRPSARAGESRRVARRSDDRADGDRVRPPAPLPPPSAAGPVARTAHRRGLEGRGRE